MTSQPFDINSTLSILEPNDVEKISVTISSDRQTLNSEDIVRIGVISDGSSLLHAILSVIYLPYKLGRLGHKIINKRDVVRTLREELADTVNKMVDGGDITYYESLSNITKSKISINDMVNILQSNQELDDRFYEFVSKVLKVNIYFISADNFSLRNMPESITYESSYDNIYLLVWANHHEVIGKLINGVLITKFNTDKLLLE